MPYMLVFRRYAPFKEFGGGFEGDDRSGPSTSLMASARTVGVVTFDGSSISINGSSSGTAFTGFGADVNQVLGKHTSKVVATVDVKTRNTMLLSFTAYTAGANPMVPLAPDIDTFVDLDI